MNTVEDLIKGDEPMCGSTGPNGGTGERPTKGGGKKSFVKLPGGRKMARKLYEKEIRSGLTKQGAREVAMGINPLRATRTTASANRLRALGIR